MLDSVRTFDIRRLALRAAAVAAITAIAGLGFAPSSMAADLNGEQYIPKPRAESPDDDPRYSEHYGHDERYRRYRRYRRSHAYRRYDDRPYYRKRYRFDPWRNHYWKRRSKRGWRSGHAYRYYRY